MTCSSCRSPILARGLCSRHYQQHRRGTLGKPRPVVKGEVQICVRVPLSTKRLLKRVAKEYRLRPSDVARIALSHYLLTVTSVQ